MRKVKENKGKDEEKGGNKIGKPKRGSYRDSLLWEHPRIRWKLRWNEH